MRTLSEFTTGVVGIYTLADTNLARYERIDGSRSCCLSYQFPVWVLDSIRLFDMTAPMQEGKHTFRMARSGSRFAGCVIESLKNKIVRFCWTSNCVSGGLLVWAPQKDRTSPFAGLAFPHARIHHVGRWNRMFDDSVTMII